MISKDEKERFFQYVGFNRSENTVIVKRRYFNFLEEIGLEDDPDKCYEEILKLKSTRINNYVSVLNNWLDFKKDTRPRYKRIRERVEDHRVREEHLTIVDIQKMIESCKSIRTKAEISIMYGAGLRLSELRNLRHEHIDLNQRKINGVKAKGNKITNAYFLPDEDHLIINIQNYLVWKSTDKIYSKYTKKEDYVFCNNKGGKLTSATIGKEIKKASEILGDRKSISPHTLRHSFVYRCMEKNIPQDAISKNIGHSSIAVTDTVYTHYNNDLLQKRFFGNNETKSKNEHKQEKIEELKSCPNCGFTGIKEDYRVCPKCRYRFFWDCKCSNLIKNDYEVCPYCGREKNLAILDTIRFYEDIAEMIKIDEILKLIQQVRTGKINQKQFSEKYKEIRKKEYEIKEIFNKNKEGAKNGI